MAKAKPTKYHDIVLAGGLHKNYVSKKETFEEIYASSASIKMLNKSQINISSPSTNIKSSIDNLLEIKLYDFKDSAGIHFSSSDLFYKRGAITKNISMGVDAGIFSIEQINEKKYKAKRYGLTLFYNNFSFRVGINSYDDFYEIVPTIKYHNSYKKHSYELEYTKQNALFYTYALVPYEKRITTNHFSISDYVSLSNNHDIWANLELNNYSNSDTEVTGQFDWRFYYDTLFSPNFSYHIALEGWYTSHSKKNSDFYSPSFSDSTMLRLDPRYMLSKWFSLKAKIAIGHSFQDKIEPYKYGIWAFGNPLNNLSYSLGCLFSNAARLSNGPSYHYRECEANLGYSW